MHQSRENQRWQHLCIVKLASALVEQARQAAQPTPPALVDVPSKRLLAAQTSGSLAQHVREKVVCENQAARVNATTPADEILTKQAPALTQQALTAIFFNTAQTARATRAMRLPSLLVGAP